MKLNNKIETRLNTHSNSVEVVSHNKILSVNGNEVNIQLLRDEAIFMKNCFFAHFQIKFFKVRP